MSTNRETALKSAMLRTAYFNDLKCEKDKTYKVLELKDSSYYKIFFTINSNTHFIEILNSKIFSIFSPNNKLEFSITNSVLYIKYSDLVTSSISIGIDYFTSFDFEFSHDTIYNGNFISTNTPGQLYYTNNITVNGDLALREISTNNIDTNSITTNQIVIGNWKFSLNKDENNNPIITVSVSNSN